MNEDSRHTLSGAAAQEELRFQVVQMLRGGMNSAAARAFGVSRTSIDRWLADRRAGQHHLAEIQAAGATPWHATRAAPGGHDCAADHRPLPRSTETAVCAVDCEAVASPARGAVRGGGLGLGRSVATWPAGVSRRRSRCGGPTSATRSRCSAAGQGIPGASSGRPKPKTPRFTGGIRWDCGPIIRPARSYGRRGQTPVIPGTGQRFRCNVMSTITNRGRVEFHGVQAELQRRRLHPFRHPLAAAAATQAAPDRGPAPGAPFRPSPAPG